VNQAKTVEARGEGSRWGARWRDDGRLRNLLVRELRIDGRCDLAGAPARAGQDTYTDQRERK
jgi:hypothetical protein